MSTCARCKKETSFFSGYMSLKGFFCLPCREITVLEEQLAGLLAHAEAAKLLEALAAHAEWRVPALRLAELTPERAALRVALAALASDGQLANPPAYLAETALRADALALWYERSHELRYLRQLLDDGQADRVLALLAKSELTLNESTLALLGALAAAGRRAAALRLALGIRGLKSRALGTLVLAQAQAGDAPAIIAWLGGARFMDIGEIADFLGAARANAAVFPPAEYRELLGAAEQQLGPIDAMHLLVMLDERELYATRLAGHATLSAELLAVFERAAARPDYLPGILEFLERHPVTGALARRSAELIDRLGAQEPKRVAEVLIAGGQWPRALALLARDNLLSPEDRLRLRDRYAGALAEAEAEAQPRLRRAMADISAGRFTDAGKALVAVAAGEMAPVAQRSAAALAALLMAAELEVALTFSRLLLLVSEQRKGQGHKPLRDAGDTERRARYLRGEYGKQVELLLELDRSPHPLLLWPDALDSAAVQAAAAAEAQRTQRLEVAAAVNATPETEMSLRQPAVINTFAAWLTAAAGVSASSPGGQRLFERALLYGLLAQRLYAPINPKSDNSELTGDKELAVACALRAVAFMPQNVELTVMSRWGGFHKPVAGFLRHHGYQPEGMQPQGEFWPRWLPSAEKIDPEARTLKVHEWLPLFDGAAPLTNAQLYRAPDADTPAAPAPAGIWQQ